MIPLQVILLPVYRVVSRPRADEQPLGLIIPPAATPTGVFLLRQYMLTLPDELLEAARIDGAGEFRIFRADRAATVPPGARRRRDLLGDLAMERLPLAADRRPARSRSTPLPVALARFNSELVVPFNLVLAMSVMSIMPGDHPVPADAAADHQRHRPDRTSDDVTQGAPFISSTARGYVRDWLVGPAWSHPCEDLGAVLATTGSPWGADGRWVLTNGPDVAPLKSRALRPAPADHRPAAAGRRRGRTVSTGESPFGTVDSGILARVHTGWDGLVDWSQFCFTPEYRHAVAATVLEVDQAEWRTLEVAAPDPSRCGSAASWPACTPTSPTWSRSSTPVRVRLPSGLTTVVTWRPGRSPSARSATSLPMRVVGLPVRVVIPSPGADERAAAIAEQLLDAIARGSLGCRRRRRHVCADRRARRSAASVDGGEPVSRSSRRRKCELSLPLARRLRDSALDARHR